MSNKESTGKTLAVVIAVCLVCSVIVSGAAVMLRPEQTANKLLDKQTNILEAAKLLEGAKGDIPGTFGRHVETMVWDLDTNNFAEQFVGATDPALYDQYKAARKDGIRPADDIAGLIHRPNKVSIYFVKNEAGKLDKIVLPINGTGLWGMMYSFLAIEMDGNTAINMVYYEHKETPGLGGEVQNSKWKAQWQGKTLIDNDGKVVIKIVKGGARPGSDSGIDALSGATLTSNGVQNMLNYWLGKDGFGPFLAKVRKGELSNG